MNTDSTTDNLNNTSTVTSNETTNTVTSITSTIALDSTIIEKNTNTTPHTTTHILTIQDKSSTTFNKLQEQNSTQQIPSVSHCDDPLIPDIQSSLSIVDQNSTSDFSECDTEKSNKDPTNLSNDHPFIDDDTFHLVSYKRQLTFSPTARPRQNKAGKRQRDRQKKKQTNLLLSGHIDRDASI